jgi:hypothetical protein
MVFSADSPDKREFARQAARKSPVGRDPSGCGRRSWQRRSEALKAQHLAALEAQADRAKGGRVCGQLLNTPEFLHEYLISRAREAAIRRGEQPPGWFKLIPVGAPEHIKNPGRVARKQREKLEREAKLAAAKQSESHS